MSTTARKQGLAHCRRPGIELETAEGRVDLHSLRHTMSTLLSRAGVPQRAAQDFMRHAHSHTTTRYTQHVQSADRRGAVDRPEALASAKAGV